MRSGETGFTLVELMVVLTIVGLLSGAVLLALPDQGMSPAREGERLAARLRAAQELAIMENGAVALRLTGTGYVFEQRQAGEWAPVAERALAPADWSEGIAAEIEGKAARIVLDPVGVAEAAEIRLTRGQERASVTLSESGEIRVRR